MITHQYKKLNVIFSKQVSNLSTVQPSFSEALQLQSREYNGTFSFPLDCVTLVSINSLSKPPFLYKKRTRSVCKPRFLPLYGQ